MNASARALAGRALKQRRKKRSPLDFTTLFLAEAAHLSRNISERSVRNLSLLAIVALSRALDISLRDLIQDVDPKR